MKTLQKYCLGLVKYYLEHAALVRLNLVRLI